MTNEPPAWRRLLIDIGTALQLLTRIPVDLRQLGQADGPPDLARSVWAFPVVGALVGAIGALAYILAWKLTGAAPLAALWAVAAMALATGAMHEDGLADTADGIGGGRTVARRLEIMRDSRIGSFGALALLFSTAIRVTAIALIAEPLAVVAALTVSGALGRAGILGVFAMSGPARPDGLAAAVGRPAPAILAAGIGLAAVLTLMVNPSDRALWLLIAAGAVSAGLAVLGRQRLGGYTGDIFGATAQSVECVALTLLVAPWAA